MKSYSYFKPLFDIYSKRGVFLGNQNVLRSTALLTMSGIAAKTIDFVFRSYYSRQLGSEGLGLFSLCFSVHGIMLTLASGGFGVAVSKVISEGISRREFDKVKGSMKLVLCTVGLLGILSVFLIFAFNTSIATWFLKEPKCAKSLVSLAPSILFMGISYCLKGYFYASRKVLAPATSEFLEQAVKIVSITFLLAKMLPEGVEKGCEAVFWGISIGEFSSCLYLFLIYIFDMGRFKGVKCANVKKLVLPIFKIALPIALSSLLGSLIRSREQVLAISSIESAGFSHNDALKLYGGIYGMVMPLIVFPLTLLSSCFTMLVPEISRAYASKNSLRLKTLVSRIYRFCGFFGFLIMCILFIFSDELSALVYGTKEISHNLKILSLLVPVMFSDSVSCGILNGMGKQTSMFLYSLTDSLGRILLIFLFVPVFGIKALLCVIILSNIFTHTLTSGKVHSIAKIHFGLRDRIFKHAFSAAVAGIAGIFISDIFFERTIGMLFSTVSLVLIYSFVEVSTSSSLRLDFDWLKNRMFFGT